MEVSFYNKAQEVWKDVVREKIISDAGTHLEFHKKILDLFHVGDYYYYFVDWQKKEFRYVSPEVESILGYSPEGFDIPFLLSLIHPDDHPVFLNHEATAVDFLQKLPNDKLLHYKISYDYRVKKANGEYVRLLQQSIALHCDTANNLLLTLGVHTDISHLKSDNTSTLSFLGLHGEPSFINVKPRQQFRPTPDIFTKREKEIMRCIIEGITSVDIAKKLYISKHTVDTHRKNILAKTNTKTTLELVIKVINEGLL